MGERFRIGEIVDRHELNVLVGERGANNVAPDASKTINGNFYRHGASARKYLSAETNKIWNLIGTFDGNKAEEKA
jgi:hypothetical protein